MQQRPQENTPRSLRSRRTDPTLPGANLPTIPVNTPPRPPIKNRSNFVRLMILKLLGFAVLLEVLFLALYPLLAYAPSQNTLVKQSLLEALPWLPRLYWTNVFPALMQGLHALPFFQISENTTTPSSGNANLLILLFGLGFLLLLLATRSVNWVSRERLTVRDVRLLFWTIVVLTGIFGLTFLCAPAGMWQDVLLYGAFGRLVTSYHVNPYVVSLNTFPADPLIMALAKGTLGTATYGPVWIDISIPIVLLVRESIANVVIGFRLLGLVVHLANATLIWVLLTKLKPEMRVSGMLLYAWNPVVLLLGVSEMHYDGVVVFFILLAALFFQRNSPLVGWLLMLVATLVNALCLLILPLFFALLRRQYRTTRGARGLLWWLLVLAASIAVVALAYAPYWPGWGIAGILSNIRQTFIQTNAINSLDATLLHLPVPVPSALAWFIVPYHWILLAAVTVGCILLLGVWLIDSLELVLLFSCWVFLALLVLLPQYWPWYVLLPLALAISAASWRSILFVMLLADGAVVAYYFWLLQATWMGQALITIGVPLLLWGWTLFFTSTWQISHNENEEPSTPGRGWSRPSWPSRRV